MIKINKGEVYVLNQPRHKLISILLVDNYSFPLIDRFHDSIDRLVEVSDVVFIFSDYHFPNQRYIDKTKFTSLYRACGFIDCCGKDVGINMFKLFSYVKEVFKHHIGYIISSTSYLNITPEIERKLLEINGSSIMKPVFKIRRLDSNELCDIYSSEGEVIREEDETIRKGVIAMIKEIFKECDLKQIEKEVNILRDELGMYCCYTSDSSLMYFRNGTINLLVSYSEDDDWDKFIRSFSYEPHPEYLLSSMIKKLRLDNLDKNIEELEFNKIKTTGK